ncbi:MAG TPA: FliM/FliN family flagellar motor switch protein [Candidatus Binataceae bacterium]|nr:FliM/FliN family flagellar motor switch protein [Candidatus Binataceae bacterium]
MHKTQTGIPALVDSYGLERSELHQLRLLAERLFDQLREELARSLRCAVRMLEVSQGAETMVEFCTDPHAQHLAILGFDGEAAVVVRLEKSLAFALVDAAFYADSPSQPRDGGERKLSLTEQYILQSTLGLALAAVLRRVFGIFFGSRTDLELMRMEHSPRLVPDALPPAEQIVTTGVKCLVGHTGGGAIDIGIPLSIILQVRTRLVPPKTVNAHDNPASRARKLLSGARVRLDAVLGHRMMPLNEVRALAPGSIILLQKLTNGVPCIELHCGGHALFSGTVVQHRGWNRFLIHRQGECDGDS